MKKTAVCLIEKKYPTNLQRHIHRTNNFKRLHLGGIDPKLATSPVIKMLIQGETTLYSGRRCSINIDDEWLMFRD